MLKPLLVGSSVFFLLLASNLQARSQTQAPAPQTLEQEAPQPQSTEVTQEELQKFANAIKQLQAIQQEAQTAMLQAVESQGLSPQQYQEILRGQKNPASQPEAEMTSEQMQSFEQARNQVVQLQQQAQSKMQQAIQSEGLQIDRFQEILAAVQQNPAVRQTVQQMMQS